MEFDIEMLNNSDTVGDPPEDFPLGSGCLDSVLIDPNIPPRCFLTIPYLLFLSSKIQKTQSITCKGDTRGSFYVHQINHLLVKNASAQEPV